MKQDFQSYSSKNYIDNIWTARKIVFDYVYRDLDGRYPQLDFDSVRMVWFSKTLQNWKAIVVTTLPDVDMYEITYNGDKDEFYLDKYQKTINLCIPGSRITTVFVGGEN